MFVSGSGEMELLFSETGRLQDEQIWETGSRVLF